LIPFPNYRRFERQTIPLIARKIKIMRVPRPARATFNAKKPRETAAENEKIKLFHLVRCPYSAVLRFCH